MSCLAKKIIAVSSFILAVSACTKQESTIEELLPIESELEVCSTIEHGITVLYCQTIKDYPSISYSIEYSVFKSNSAFVFLIEGIQEKGGYDAIGPASFRHEFNMRLTHETKICFRTSEWNSCGSLAIDDTIGKITFDSQNSNVTSGSFCEF